MVAKSRLALVNLHSISTYIQTTMKSFKTWLTLKCCGILDFNSRTFSKKHHCFLRYMYIISRKYIFVSNKNNHHAAL